MEIEHELGRAIMLTAEISKAWLVMEQFLREASKIEGIKELMAKYEIELRQRD